MIELCLTDGRTSFMPGEAITGTIHWSGDQGPAWLEVRLFWYTDGKGTQDVGVVAAERVNDPGASGERSFNLIAPGLPLSCSGRLVSFRWALELVSADDQPVVKRELVIGPDAHEVILGHVE